MRNQTALRVAVMVSIAATAATLAQPHTGDLWLAVSAAGQLKISPRGFVPDGSPASVVVLDEVAGPLFFGWTRNSPGFDDIETPDPENNCYPLAAGASVWLEIVAMDPALIVWDVQLKPYFNPGERVYVGVTPGLHSHLIWHINSKFPNFEQLHGLKVHWRAMFRLVDTGGTGYAASAPFPMIFGITECVTGDVSGDGRVDFGDINPFVEVLLQPGQATVEQRCAADINLDGWVDFGDINPFVALLTNP